jgi:hypothetical protein
MLSAAEQRARARAERVDRSDETGIRFELADLAVTWQRHRLRDGTLELDEPRIGGFVNAGVPGRPRLPRRGGWLVVPPGHRAELHVIAESWQDAGGRRLMVEATPVLLPDPESDGAIAGTQLLLPGETPRAGAVIPPVVLADRQRAARMTGGPAVVLGEPSLWRGRRIVSYAIEPVQADPTGRATRRLDAGSYEIRFVPETTSDAELERAAAVYADRRDGRNDERFAAAFLNGELLDRLPTEAAVGAAPARLAKQASAYEPLRGPRATDLLAPEIKLSVKRTRLYRVTAQGLLENGLLAGGAAVSADQIRLYQRRYVAELDDGTGPPWIEIEVPIRVRDDGGAFEGNDAFFFYGLRLRDDTEYTADFGSGAVTVPGSGDPYEMNNEGNVYWLAFAGPPPGGWSRMETGTLPPAAGPPLETYRRTDHFEEAVAFRQNVPNASVDRIYANNYFATSARVGLTLWSPDPAGVPVELQAEVAGQRINRVDLAFRLDDGDVATPIGTVGIVSRDASIFSTTFAPTLLTQRTVDLVMTKSSGTGLLMSFLNWVELTYDADYVAVQDELLFSGGDAATVDHLEVTGFTSTDIGAVEVTDPRRPVLLTLEEGVQRLSDGDGGKLALQVDQTGGAPRTFYARTDLLGAGVGEVLYFQAERVDDPADPTDPGGPPPDLLVITHPEFRSGLDRWIAHRQARAEGTLDVHVVEVDDIYDWYNGGLMDPWALKRLVNHAVNVWGSWALVLVGDANENVRELEVNVGGRPYATDWVPTHLHSQYVGAGYDPELIATDKWFAVPAADDANWPEWRYPLEPLAMLPDLYVGRFPCNSRGELDAAIDKVIAVETSGPGETWRRRGVFMADDSWSQGYVPPDDPYYLTVLTWASNELAFARSERDSLARYWRENGGGVTLAADTLNLRTFLDPFDEHADDPTHPPRDLSDFRGFTAATATPAMIAALSQGATVVHYQGHANARLLTHEHWLIDDVSPNERDDLHALTNDGRYFVFFGMGCHISDWAQSTVHPNSGVYNEPSIGEKLLVLPGRGAVATYGSPGYEFLTSNKVASEYMMRRWLFEPPTATVDGRDVHSRWVVGELIWAGEADLLATLGYVETYRELVAQYVLLGDPLVVLDGGAPEVVATLQGTPDQEISGDFDLVSLDETNRRSLVLEAGDEAGIDRLRVEDSRGQLLAEVRDPGDVSEIAQIEYPLAPVSHQRAVATLTLPVRPFEHTLTVDLFDTSDRQESDDHWQLRLHVRQAGVFFGDGGVEIDPDSYRFPLDAPVEVTGQITTAAWIDASSVIELRGRNLTVENVQIDPGASRSLGLSFTATATGSEALERAVVLSIDGFETDYVLQRQESPVADLAITDLYCFPNPFRDGTRFLFRSGAPASPGRVVVYTVSGRQIADLGFTYGGGGEGVVAWNGRDREGDELANGVYLYRVLLNTPSGRIASDMQRLVIMR